MANIILTKELNKAFTEVVNGYLATGMTIHVNSMSGHQGEMAKVDLSDGTDVYRINMTDESCYGEGKNEFHGRKVVITVEKFEGKDQSDGFRAFDTLWTGKGEQVGAPMEWYELGNNRKAWTDSIEYAGECQMKHYNRLDARDDHRWRDKEQEIRMDSEEQRTFVRDMCRQHRGYGRIKRAEITKLTKTVWSDGSRAYKVYFNNGKNALVIKRVKAVA